ncbi:MAG TPA: YbhB/YbcL family Raf kinase inhibitor-like protein [Chitinophagaceae bacterium]|nr:YbhB/YbcL family Raf kinase inhibitor-like protein [Chitinophagaceae bacterium]
MQIARDSSIPADFKALRLSSPSFQEGGAIPVKYTCDGENISPPLDIAGIPAEALSLAIIVEDPDAPGGTWNHWLAWNLPVTHHLRENRIHGEEGLNSFQQVGYGGPCPPPGKPHRYQFKVYALDQVLDLKPRIGTVELERAMAGHILAYGELMGLYQRKSK